MLPACAGWTSLVRWTCYNSVFLIFAIHAHNACPWRPAEGAHAVLQYQIWRLAVWKQETHSVHALKRKVQTLCKVQSTIYTKSAIAFICGSHHFGRQTHCWNVQVVRSLTEVPRQEAPGTRGRVMASSKMPASGSTGQSCCCGASCRHRHLEWWRTAVKDGQTAKLDL